MPDVYKSGQRIPELKGSVRGGAAVIVHSPYEVEVLETLLEGAARLPGDPLATAHDVVVSSAAQSLTWSRSVRSQEGERPHEGPAGDALRALAIAQGLWRDQGEDSRALALALVLPRSRKRRRRLQVELGRPALVLDEGSVRARLLTAGARLRDFGVALFPVARSRRQANLVEALRGRAVAAGGKPLPRLEGVSAEDLAGKSAVVVFVHGLISTDAGTFDGLVDRLAEDPVLGSTALCVGWPHDTLARIDDNGADLAELLEAKVGRSQLPVVFVCHSRGGLVARACAAELAEASQGWRERLRGCVTFGTPHLGAELAEMADEILGKLLLLTTIARGGQAVPLVDALWAVYRRKRLRGITDLRPRRGGGKFLRRLARSESRLSGQVGGPSLPILAVGGNAPPSGMTGWLSNRFLAGVPNDHVVALSSSAPANFAWTLQAPCDHFSYFAVPEQPRLEEAIAFLTGALAATVSPPSRPVARERPRSSGGRRSSTMAAAETSRRAPRMESR